MNAGHQLIRFVFLATVVATVHAQTPAPAPADQAAPPSAPPQLSEADLEKLVAPIALYPDPLLATLLPASAYPLDIVKAARFIQNTNNIPKVDSQPWDQNVKALARFPDVIKKMNDDIDWTSDLGDAFVSNQKGVMNAIQVMRNKAEQAGSLKTTPQQVVTVTNNVVQQTVEQQVVYVTNTVVQIQPSSPNVVYVPTYNPAYVYAPPPAGYVAAASFVSFGAGMMWGAALANNCNWHSGGVYHGDVNVNKNINVNRTAQANRNFNNRNTTRANQNFNNRQGNVNRGNAGGGGQKWQADSSRRGSGTGGASQQSRGWSGGGGGYSGKNSDAFNNLGGGSQSRAASSRGATSRGGSGFRGGSKSFSGGGRGGGGFRGGGGGRGGGRR